MLPKLSDVINRHINSLIRDGLMPTEVRACDVRIVEITENMPTFNPLTDKDRERNAELFQHYEQLRAAGKRPEAVLCLKELKNDPPRYIVRKSELRELSKYEARFEQLQGMGYHAIFIVLYGMHEGHIIFGIEPQEKVPPDFLREGHITIIKTVGPDGQAIQSKNWETRRLMFSDERSQKVE